MLHSMFPWCALMLLFTFYNYGLAIKIKDPTGYSDFFQSNLEEFCDKPIFFNKPIPKWIKGALVRNGAGRFELGPRSFKHTFDGFGKLHSFKFYGNGSASMSTKFIYTDMYNKSLSSTNIAPYVTFEPVDPPFEGIEILKAFHNSVDNTNINIYRILNQKTGKYEYMTLNDIWKIYQIDNTNLNTIKQVVPKVDIRDSVYQSMSSSAHPVKEFGKESYITFLTFLSLIPGVKSKMVLFRMTSVSAREEIVNWDIDELRYLHSFAVTENFAVLIAPPIFMKLFKLFTSADVLDAMEFKKDSPTLIYLVDLRTKNVTTLKSDPLFFLHHINAFEQNDEIVVDVCGFDNITSVKIFELHILRDPTIRNNMQYRGYIQRFVINKDTFKEESHFVPTSGKVPFSTNVDMPTINEKYRHRKYCYFYGIGMKIDNVNTNNYAIVKKDMCRKGGDLAWSVKDNYPSEAYFVSTPNSTEEDDGILMTHVYDGHKRKSYILLLNATDMRPISRSYLPTFVPMSFHGRFFSDGHL